MTFTAEGEVLPLCQYPLELTSDDGEQLFLQWPVTVMHKIDSSSPLWELSAEILLTERFEVRQVTLSTMKLTLPKKTNNIHCQPILAYRTQRQSGP